MDHKFKNEVFSSYDPNPVPTCSECGERTRAILSMLNPQNGKAVRIFKCKCGEQTWTEDK